MVVGWLGCWVVKRHPNREPPMPFEALESKRVYQHAEHVSDTVWELSEKWNAFVRQTVGSQMIRAADSIGANVAEAAGRFHPADVCNFFYFARGSLYETR